MIQIAARFWVVGEVVPVADDDDAYCGEGDCPKRGLKFHTIIRIRDTATGILHDSRRVGCCCAKEVYGADPKKGERPMVPPGMLPRYVEFWDVRDQCGKRMAAFALPQEAQAREHAVKVGGTACRNRGWELYPDPTVAPQSTSI